MNLDKFNIVYNDSIFSCTTELIYKYLKESFLYKSIVLVKDILITSYKNSIFKTLFENEDPYFHNFFKNTILIIILKVFLKLLINKISLLKERIINKSVIISYLIISKDDIVFNPIKYLSYILFCWLTSYSIINLLFGSGFMKSEVKYIILLTLSLFIFTRSEIVVKEMIDESFIIKWIKKLLN